MHTKKTVLIACIVIALALAGEAIAVSIGVSPGHFETGPLTRGGYYEQVVTISTATDEELTGQVSREGPISSWINVSELDFEFSKGSPALVKVSIHPPLDAANGDYNGSIRFMTSGLGALEGNTGSRTVAAALITFLVTVSDQETIACYTVNSSFGDAEPGQDVIFYVGLANSGNVRINPTVSVDVWNKEQTDIMDYHSFTGRELRPTTSEMYRFAMPTDALELGQYWADIRVEECGLELLHTFDIVEPGTLRASGVLQKITNEVYTEEKKPAEITAVFVNTGEIPVLARFMGVVELDGVLMDTLESDSLEVGVGETVELSTFYTPEHMGRYVIKGKVTYGTKQTFESDSVLNVYKLKDSAESSEKTRSPLDWIIPAVILILVILIARKKKKQRH